MQFVGLLIRPYGFTAFDKLRLTETYFYRKPKMRTPWYRFVIIVPFFREKLRFLK